MELPVGVTHDENVVMKGHRDDGVIVTSLEVDDRWELVRVEVQDASRGRVSVSLAPEGQFVILDTKAEHFGGSGKTTEKLCFLVASKVCPECCHKIF